MSVVPLAVSVAFNPTIFAVDVLAGQWNALRLKDLPKDVIVSLAVTSNSAISVEFLTATDHRQFPYMT